MNSPLAGVDEQEHGFRLAMWRRIVEAHGRDEPRQDELRLLHEHQAVGRPRAVAILDRFEADRDLERFRADLQQWAADAANGYPAFNGVNWQMFVNQLANRGADTDLPDLLSNSLRTPTDEAEAQDKLASLGEWILTVKKGAHPAPARVPFLCSFFWSLQDHDRWPCLWRSGETTLVRLGWLAPPANQIDRYLDYRAEVIALDGSPDDVETALHWYQDHADVVGLDPSLVDQCALLVALKADPDADPSLAPTTARGLLGGLTVFAETVKDQVAETLGRSVRVVVPRQATGPQGEGTRTDGWIDWRLAGPGSTKLG